MMNDIVNYWGFLIVCILLNFIFGLDIIYIIICIIVEGKKLGIVFVFGI